MSDIEAMAATSGDRDRMIAILTAAFVTDPLIRWMFPDAARYLDVFPTILAVYGGGAFDHGSAYRTSDHGGAALWLPPGIGPDEDALGALIAENVAPERHETVFALFEQIGAAHPAEAHWFLPAIGVDPPLQGRGHGAALMTRALEVSDAARAPAYLEASNASNIPFYARFGFEVVGRMQAGDSPEVTAMFRAAR